MTSRLLVVCTANVCRSASSAALLRAVLSPEIEVTSAGTRAADGSRVCPVASEWVLGSLPSALRERAGADLAAHRAAQLSAETIREADLVLTMTRQHRSAVVALVPGAQRMTFPIRYAARAVPDVAAGPSRPPRSAALPWLAAELHDRRGDLPLVAEADDEVPDPHLDRLATHEQAFALLGSSLGALLELLGS